MVLELLQIPYEKVQEDLNTVFVFPCVYGTVPKSLYFASNQPDFLVIF